MTDNVHQTVETPLTEQLEAIGEVPTPSNRFNINDEVLVTLTDDGLKVWERYRFPSLDKRPDGRCAFQLWELMMIFGPKTSMGGKQHFEDNKIEIIRTCG